jgi:hypothetical protein
LDIGYCFAAKPIGASENHFYFFRYIRGKMAVWFPAKQWTISNLQLTMYGGAIK